MNRKTGKHIKTDGLTGREVGSRRKLLTLMTRSGMALSGAALLPSKWISPVVDMIVIPAHAQTSCVALVNRQVVFDTPGSHEFVVDDCVERIEVEVIGAGGGSGAADAAPGTPATQLPTRALLGDGGAGALTGGFQAVSPGQVLQIFVGEGGSGGTNNSAAGGGGDGSGGAGQVTEINGVNYYGGGGGGASSVAIPGMPVMRAAGGGGGGASAQTADMAVGTGGAGAGTDGNDGNDGSAGGIGQMGGGSGGNAASINGEGGTGASGGTAPAQASVSNDGENGRVTISFIGP